MGLVGMLALSVVSAGCGSDSVSDADASAGNDGTADVAEGTEAGTAAAEETGSVTYPLNADTTVSWYAQEGIIPHEKYASADESPFHTGLEEALGVDIDWSFPTTGSDAGTFTSTMLADPDELPNIMEGQFMSNASQYMDDGFFWDLTDYIQEYAPDYYAFLQTNPAYDKAMKDDQGRYYCFGFFREDGGWNDSYLGPVIRTDWLEECGLEIPTTISELENVIRVFNETYGATFDAAASRIKETGFSGAFGAYGNYNVGNYSWYVKDGTVGLGQAEDEWRDYVSWQNALWEDGLIDQDILSEDDTTIKDKVYNDKVGVSITSMGQMNIWNNDLVAAGKEAVWVGIPNITGDDGTLSCVFGGQGIGTNTAVITTTADEETMKLCLKMLNYAYTEEGFLYWNYGTEGVSWEYDENGVPKFTSLVTDDADTDPMTKYNGATWGNSCIQATNLLYLKNSEAAIAANDAWYYIYDDEEKNLEVTGGWRYPVGITYTTEEADEMDEIGQNIGTYVSESYASFLTGASDVNDDTVWEAYLADLESYNLSRILEIRQAAYDRYAAR